MLQASKLFRSIQCYIGLHQWEQNRCLNLYDIRIPSLLPYIPVRRTCLHCERHERLFNGHRHSFSVFWHLDAVNALLLADAGMSLCRVGDPVLVAGVNLEFEVDVVGKIARMNDSQVWVLIDGYSHTNANGYQTTWDKVKKIVKN